MSRSDSSCGLTGDAAVLERAPTPASQDATVRPSLDATVRPSQDATHPPYASRPGSPRIVVDSLASMDAARGAWVTAAEENDNIFSTWEWAETWWRHFGTGRRLQLAHVHDGAGRELAVLPMHSELRARIRISRFLGNGVADQLGPICRPGDTVAAAQALNSLSSASHVLVAERLPENHAWERDLHGHLLYKVPSPVISLAQEGGWDDYLGARSTNFRQQVRRRARRLSRELGVRYRLADDPARLGQDFDAMLALHAARWGASSPAFVGTRRAFHRDFAACALERGWLRLWLAESDGQPIAAWYGFRFAGVESYYQAGRRPGLDRFGLGVGILEHSIREAFSDGMREYRMLLGDEQYKSRYATFTPSVRTVVVPHTALGRVAIVLGTALAHASPGRRLMNSTRLRARGSTGTPEVAAGATK